MKTLEPTALLSRYAVAQTIDECSWLLKAEGGPDINMRQGTTSVSLWMVRWELEKADEYAFDSEAMLVERDTILFQAVYDFENDPTMTPDQVGRHILEAIQEMTRTRISWKRGNEAEADAIIGIVCDLTGFRVNFDVQSEKRDHPILEAQPEFRNRSQPFLPPSPAILKDIAAYFHPVSNSGEWIEDLNDPGDHECRSGSAFRVKFYEAQRPELTAHERLQALEAVASFYQKASPALGLSEAQVEERMAELTSIAEDR